MTTTTPTTLADFNYADLSQRIALCNSSLMTLARLDKHLAADERKVHSAPKSLGIRVAGTVGTGAAMAKDMLLDVLTSSVKDVAISFGAEAILIDHIGALLTLPIVVTLLVVAHVLSVKLGGK